MGFRPFVYTLADKFKLVGEIYNDDEGVKLNFSGDEASFLAFEKELYEKLPALARIDELKKFKIDKFIKSLRSSLQSQPPNKRLFCLITHFVMTACTSFMTPQIHATNIHL